MRVSYREFFSITCLHGYFADRVCESLTLQPTIECERMLGRYRLLFRPTRGGGRVFWGEQAGVDPLRDYREITPFTFALLSTDPLLETYTDCAINRAVSGGVLHYFSNRASYVATIGGQQQQLLHPQGKALEPQPLPLRPSLFTHRFQRPLRASTLRVLSDPLPGRVAWEAQTPAEEVTAWTIDLRGQPSGRYQLQTDGALALEFYLCDVAPKRKWGVIEVFAGGAELGNRIPPECQIIDGAGQVNPRRFAIALSPRATVWRYYIFDPLQGSSDAGSRIDGSIRRAASAGDTAAQPIGFNRLPGRVMCAGREAVVFESQQPVVLCESPAQENYLFTFKADAGGPVVNLPCARPVATRLEASADGACMLSEIFVYL